jgi:hypothetical protein
MKVATKTPSLAHLGQQRKGGIMEIVVLVIFFVLIVAPAIKALVH